MCIGKLIKKFSHSTSNEVNKETDSKTSGRVLFSTAVSKLDLNTDNSSISILHNSSCISGNIVQIGCTIEAREGLSVGEIILKDLPLIYASSEVLDILIASKTRQFLFKVSPDNKSCQIVVASKTITKGKFSLMFTYIGE